MEVWERCHKKVRDSGFLDFAILHHFEHLAPDCGVHFGNAHDFANHVMLGNAWEVQGFYYRTNLHHVSFLRHHGLEYTGSGGNGNHFLVVDQTGGLCAHHGSHFANDNLHGDPLGIGQFEKVVLHIRNRIN